MTGPASSGCCSTAKEIKSLGLGDAKAEQVQKKVDAALANFAKAAEHQKMIVPGTKWVSFGGNSAGRWCRPAPTIRPADLTVYENVMAMIETDGKPQAIGVGTMVRVGDAWRLIDAPQLTDALANGGGDSKPFFMDLPRPDRPTDGRSTSRTKKLKSCMKELQQTGRHQRRRPRPNSTTRRAELIEEIAKEVGRRAATHVVSQPGRHAERRGADRRTIRPESSGSTPCYESLKDKDEELAFYVQFRALTADHSRAIVGRRREHQLRADPGRLDRRSEEVRREQQEVSGHGRRHDGTGDRPGVRRRRRRSRQVVRLDRQRLPQARRCIARPKARKRG